MELVKILNLCGHVTGKGR